MNQNNLHLAEEILWASIKRYIKAEVRHAPTRLGAELRIGIVFPGGRDQMLSSMFLNSEGLMVSERNYPEFFIRHAHEASSNLFNSINIWMKIAKDELKFSEIIAIRDIEQRMVALKRYGVEKVLHDAKAELIEKSQRGNELYMIPESSKVFSQDAYYLKYSDPSTGRIYISGVPPEMGRQKNADACMAWKHGLSVEAYKILFQEA